MRGEASYVAGNPRLSAAGLLVAVSGCSGAGKSAVVGELARRGYPVFPEPGRQVVKEEMLVDGPAVPWKDMAAFADRCFARAIHFFNSADSDDAPTFFDRSIVEPIVALERIGRVVPGHWLSALERYRYNRKVFLADPWPEIFRADGERRHDFSEAVREYEALRSRFPKAGYDLIDLPRVSVAERADFIVETLSKDAQP